MIIRFGVSLEDRLLKQFDLRLKERAYTTRSEAIRDLIREELVRKQWQEGGEVAGAITLIFNHHQRELLSKMTSLQHDFQKIIISTQHIHLNHHDCLEILAVKGHPKQVQRLADALRAIKGVRHGTLSTSSTGEGLD